MLQRSLTYEVRVSNQTESLLGSLQANPLSVSYSLAGTLNYWFDAFELTGTRGFGPKVLRYAADHAEIIEACKVIAELGEVISARRVQAMISKPSTVIDPKLGGALIKNARQDQIAGRTLEKVAN